MLRSLTICSSCRRSLFHRSGPEEWIRTQQHVVRRHRSKGRGSNKSKPSSAKSLVNLLLEDLKPFQPPFKQAFNKGKSSRQKPSFFRYNPGLSSGEEGGVFLPFDHENASIPEISPDDIIPYFEENVHSWASAARTKERLKSFGLPRSDIIRLLDAFVEDVKIGLLSEPDNISYYGLQRFSQPHDATSIDVIYSTVFFWWASNPENEHVLQEDFRVDLATIRYIQRLVKATSRDYPADEWPRARSLQRKIIMHVGPTNSGKTHHALRALAAAKSGVYAGPLRLLAYEIWHRLNTGQIVPLGVEADNDDGSQEGNPKYAKLCDMITGEEQRIMGTDVRLKSCTVEMIPLNISMDVAVIDEIQMINDRSRGGGWVDAVLGVAAKEVHLCGEESAVPVVKALLKATGDEVEVRRYERLTPLVVEDKSLEGDLTKIREGDCIVTFSRSKIFYLKKLVEAETGMRCAVIYGRLPPEVRSEQAALFNDPNSGYDVLIGSDAIGMGLNLKIRRVIFETIHKFNDGSRRMLSTSSIKQIGGRAGRYGVHQSQADLGGKVTTMFPEDLPDLAHWINAPYAPLSHTSLSHDVDVLHATLSILPPGSSMSLGLLAPRYIGRLPSFMRYQSHENLDHIGAVIDDEWSDMATEDKLLLLHAPIPWRDEQTVRAIKRMLAIHAREFSVTVEGSLQGQGLLEALEKVEERMQREHPEGKLVENPATLMQLESLHKVLVFYKWMSHKNSVVYSDDTITEIKERSEKALIWVLERVSKKGADKDQEAMSRLKKKGLAKEDSDGLKEELGGELTEDDPVEDDDELSYQRPMTAGLTLLPAS